jgi:hypothetical protein
MNSQLPPPPPEDDDRERKWIIEGLRQALTRAPAEDLARLLAQLGPVADGGPATEARGMLSLVALQI